MDDRYGLLRQLASEFHVESLSIRGQYGVIQGPSTDNVILRWYATTGTWSEATNTMVADRLTEGGTFIDVGANLGLTTIPAARNPQVRVIAFEPDPTCFRYLQANVAANCPAAAVTLHNAAVFDEATDLTFEIASANHGDNRVRVTAAPGALQEEPGEVVTVRAVSLDQVVDVRGRLVVKIDTQGAEPFVVKGARATLARAELVFLEYWPYGMARLAADVSIIHEAIGDFASIALRREGGTETTRLSHAEALVALTALDQDDPEEYVDIILAR
ncbi:MAG: FkbM family methyltransferase [Luteitalea sp.]